MDNDIKEKVYCDDNGENRIYCNVCDKLAIDRYYNNHLKSQTQMNNFRERQQFNNTNNSTTFSTSNNSLDFKEIVSFNKGHKRPSCDLEIFFISSFINL